MTLRYLSLCSGIEAASVAWRPLGWEAVAFSEIEAFPCAVLAHHYPDVPNLGDMTKVRNWSKYRGAVDLVVAGTPCQDFSIAGKRAGMARERSGLALEFVRILAEVRPRWIVWENVPGIFSTNGGRDFGTFIGALDDCGYSCAWRVLDAQFFGVPQRRRRVFIVGHLGDWRPAAAVLFERESVCGDTPARGKAAKDIPGTLEAGIARSRGAGTPPGSLIGTNLPAVPDVAGTMNTAGWKNGATMAAGYMVPCSQYGTLAASLTSEGADASPCADRGPTVLAVRTAQSSANGNGIAEEVSHTLDRTNGQAVIAFPSSQESPSAGRDDCTETCACYVPEIVSQALSSKWEKGTSGPAGDEHHNLVASLAFTERSRSEGRTLEYLPEQAYCLMNPGSGGRTHSRQILTPQLQVRRLTPREYERLQGFPDDYTAIEYRGKPAADGPRYRTLGNSMAVPVMRWIGERISRQGSSHEH